jgi:hypothetical protein
MIITAAIKYLEIKENYMKAINWLLVTVLTCTFTACGGGGGDEGSKAGTSVGTSTQTATLTVSAGARLAASIAIAQGDTIVNTDPIFYEQRFAATVATTAGLPVVGAKVALNVQYPAFFKGAFIRDAQYKATSVNRYLCPGEDANNNDVLDADEDKNANGQLDPAKALVTATFEGPSTTDQNGNVKILVRYPKRHASWVLYRLNTTVTVTGTEGKAGFNLGTGYVVGDEEKASTPFALSPFGITPSCSDAN